MARRKVVKITVVCNDGADECMYVNGKAWEGSGESTVFCSDIFMAMQKYNAELIEFDHVSINTQHSQWPDKLEDVLDPDHVLF